ncbi:MAG: type IV pilin protein [Gammaproteobacteria bacterium]|nr:type IV pilin protein [Gammaproteobacteria bacterium]
MYDMTLRIQSGFTMAELMIVMVIAAILASIAVPSYQDFVTRSKRSQAKSVLLQVADKQEQFFLDNKRYAATMTDLGYAANPFYIDSSSDQQASSTTDSIYKLEFSATTNTTYAVAAVPLGAQASHDSGCGTISVNNTGKRDQSGTSTDCW